MCRLFNCTLKHLPSILSEEEYDLWKTEYSIYPWDLDVHLIGKIVSMLGGKEVEHYYPMEIKPKMNIDKLRQSNSVSLFMSSMKEWKNG